MSEPNCEGHPAACYERRRCSCNDRFARQQLMLILIGIAVVVCCTCSCTPKQPARHPAPIEAPPPGYGKKVVLSSEQP